ncbi:MAG: DUF1761 domain-containing protein [Flavobacteriales bacterium]
MENANWIAYAVAVVAQMVIGFLWFHPSVMGKMWAKAIGTTVEGLKPKNPGMVYGLTILYTLLFTFFLMTNVTGPGQDVAPDGHSYATFQHGLAHAVALTLMVILPVLGTPALFEGKSKGWMIVQVGYWFVRMAVALGILSAWR